MKRFALLVILGFLLAACAGAGEVAETSAPMTATTEPSPGTTAAVTTPTVPETTSSVTEVEAWQPREHWVGVEGDRFVDNRRGETFVPRGVNLLHKFVGGHVDGLFGTYQPERIDGELDAVAGWGFNTIRVFLDMCNGCVADEDGVRSQFIDDLADFVARVAERDLVVLFTSNDLPDTATFHNSLPCCDPFGGYRNSLYLTGEGVEAGKRYFSEIVGGLVERGAPLEAVLGWQLANEQFFLTDVAPLSIGTGTVTVANGSTYDLADPDSVRAMVEESLIHYVDEVAGAIREIDPHGLVTIGFFEPNEPVESRPDDNRLVLVQRVMRESTLDFFDLHAYSGGVLTIDEYAQNYGLADFDRTPVLLGEFGAFRHNYESPEVGAGAVARWQAASCAHGFDGWLFWLWGGSDDEVWTGTEGDGAISRALSPHTRPDPCEPGAYVSRNLAEGRPVTVSAEEPDLPQYGAVHAVDGSDGTWWSAGAGAPQWIEIDLEGDRAIERVDVLIGSVSPPGPQRHRLLVRRATGEPEVVWEFGGAADHGDTLSFVPDVPLEGVAAVRLETLEVDGWVIIHEIRVIGD